MSGSGLDALAAALDGLDELAVAVSGGVDSTTLMAAAARLLPRRATGWHAVSPAVPPEATARLQTLGTALGWRLELIDAGELDDPDYLANPVDRCFFCKRDLYGTIRARTAAPLASGTNLDDLGDYRPGLEAARRHDVRHPFVEAGMDKAAVRRLARELGLGEVAELPAAPCLSSRIETGISVTHGRLALILEAERLVARRLGTGTIRCRVRPATLEIELGTPLYESLDADMRAELAAGLEALQQRLGRVGPVRFAAYRRGSAFLHKATP